jgi:hypothetical protein
MGDDPSAEFAVGTIAYRAKVRKMPKVPNPTSDHRLNTSTVFVVTPHGALFTIDPTHAEAVADGLTPHIPAWTFGHVARGDYWLVTPRYAETARVLVLATTGALLRLWSPSYPQALARLARYGRGAAASAVAA